MKWILKRKVTKSIFCELKTACDIRNSPMSLALERERERETHIILEEVPVGSVILHGCRDGYEDELHQL